MAYQKLYLLLRSVDFLKIADDAPDLPITISDGIGSVAAVQLFELFQNLAINLGTTGLRFRKRPLGGWRQGPNRVRRNGQWAVLGSRITK